MSYPRLQLAHSEDGTYLEEHVQAIEALVGQGVKSTIVSGAAAASDIAVPGIKATDRLFAVHNLTDLTDIIVAAVKASLAIAGKGDGKLDTVIQAKTAGGAGNAITVAVVMDAGAQVGSVARVGSAFAFHLKPAVSTVADFEALVAGLGGGDALIEIKTGGTGETVLDAGTAFAAAHLAAGADAYTEAPAVTSAGNIQFAASNTTGKKLLVQYVVA